MSVAKVALVALALSAAFCSDAFAQRGRLIGNPIPPQSSLNRFKLTKAWAGQATLDSTRDRVQFLTLDDDKLFVQSNSGFVTAFESETGRRLWSRHVGKPDSFMFAAAVADDGLVIAVGMELFSLQKGTGDVQWKQDLQRQPCVAPAVDDEAVYVSGLDGSVTSYDMRLTRQRFMDGLLPKYYRGTIRWIFNSHREILVPPVPVPGQLQIASSNGSLYAMADDKLKLNYQIETEAPISAPMVLFRDSLIFATGDNRLYSLDVRNGTILWQNISSRRVVKALQVIQEDLFMAPDRSGLYCLSAKTGSDRWHCPQADQFVAATPSLVYATDRQHNLLLISRERGSVLAALPLHQFSIPLANDRSDRIFLATSTGVVLALHDRSINDPKFYKFPERQPILPEFAPEGSGTDSTSEETTSPDADSEEMPAEESEEMPAEEEGAVSEE